MINLTRRAGATFCVETQRGIVVSTRKILGVTGRAILSLTGAGPTIVRGERFSQCNQLCVPE